MDLGPLALRTARKLERGLAGNSLPAVADARADLRFSLLTTALVTSGPDALLRLLARGVQAQEARRAALNGDSRLAQAKPIQEQVNALAKEYGVRDRRAVRLEPEPPVIAEQLALAV